MGQERRQYYRVEKDVALEVQRVEAEEISRFPQPSRFEVSPYFELLADVQALDKQQQPLLQQLANEHPQLATILDIHAQKLALITQALASSGLKISHLSKQTINLSEGGMQFSSTDCPCAVGDFLAIKLIFSNPLLGVLVYGQVQRVMQHNGALRIAVQFHQMPESCRLLIAQRVMQSQQKPTLT